MFLRFTQKTRGALAGLAWVSAISCLLVTGCAPQGAAGPAPGTTGTAPKSTGGASKKVVVIRLNDPVVGSEAIEADIQEGLAFGAKMEVSFKVETLDAKGDIAAVPKLVQSAVSSGADLIMTLLPETTLAATANIGKVPLVFAMTGEPSLLGIDKGADGKPLNITGAFSSTVTSLIVPIARGCLPKAKKLGILFNPDNKISVSHKDALIKTPWYNVEPVYAEYHSESEIPSAIKKLIEQKAEGIVLTWGMGAGSKAAIEEAKKAKIPSFGYIERHAIEGAIVARVASLRWEGFEAGRRGGRLLKGESIELMKFVEGAIYQTYVNTTSAKEIGATILGPLMRDAKVVGAK